MSSGLSNWVTIFPIDAFELPVLLKRNYFQMPSGLVRDMAVFLRVSEISIYNFTIICFMHLLMGWWYVGVFVGDHEDVRTLERVFSVPLLDLSRSVQNLFRSHQVPQMGKSKGPQDSYIMQKLIDQNLLLKKSTDSKKCGMFPVARYQFPLSYLLCTPGAAAAGSSLDVGGVGRTWPGRHIHAQKHKLLFLPLCQIPCTAAVRGWCGLNAMCPVTQSCSLPLGFLTLLLSLFTSRTWNGVSAVAAAQLGWCLPRLQCNKFRVVYISSIELLIVGVMMVQVDRDLCDGRCCIGGWSGGAVLSTPLAPLGFVLCPLPLQSPLYLLR